MTKEEYYRKLLEAQVRGMLVGSYETNGNLTGNERQTYFDEAFKRGFFMKDGDRGEKYETFDEMLEAIMLGVQESARQSTIRAKKELERRFNEMVKQMEQFRTSQKQNGAYA
mgnify:CR=1 FL=1